MDTSLVATPHCRGRRARSPRAGGFDNSLAFMTAGLCAATVLLAPPVTVGLIVDARHQKRAGGQLRLGPAPSPGG